MSSISSVNNNSYLYSLLQSVNGQSQSATSTNSTTTTDPTTQSPTDLLTAALQSIQNQPTTAGQPAQGAGGAHRHHHHHGGGGGEGGGGQFFQSIQSAVTTALQSAPTDGSSDPNQIIENAISSVLNGQGDPATDGTTNASGTASNDTANASDPAANRKAFDQLLQSYGVSSQQFHADFASAIKDAGASGKFDPSKAFQSFPPGTIVDTAA